MTVHSSHVMIRHHFQPVSFSLSNTHTTGLIYNCILNCFKRLYGFDQNTNKHRNTTRFIVVVVVAMQILDSTTGEIVYDTFLRDFSLVLGKSVVEYAAAYASGGVGFVILYKGLIPVVLDLHSCLRREDSAGALSISETTTTADYSSAMEGPGEEQRWIITLWKHFKRVLTGLLRFCFNGNQSRTMSILSCFHSGGMIALGLYIMLQPLLAKLRELNIKTVYYVH